MARTFHLAQLVGSDRIRRQAPHLTSAVTKLLSAVEFETPASLEPEEADALINYIHGYVRAGQRELRRKSSAEG